MGEGSRLARLFEGWLLNSGEKALGKRETAKKKGGVNGIAGKRVPEERNGGDVTGGETRRRARVERTKDPKSEI